MNIMVISVIRAKAQQNDRAAQMREASVWPIRISNLSISWINLS